MFVMTKSDKFKLDVTGCQDVIRELCDKNDDFSLSKSDLLDQFGTDDRVFKFTGTYSDVKIVPDDQDPKTLRVVLYDDIIGTVKKGSVSHVKNLTGSPEFKSLFVELYGGDYKHITYDDDVVQNKDSEYFADLYITTEPAGQNAAPAAPVAPAAFASLIAFSRNALDGATAEDETRPEETPV